jgi:hypothetical protein
MPRVLLGCVTFPWDHVIEAAQGVQDLQPLLAQVRPVQQVLVVQHSHKDAVRGHLTQGHPTLQLPQLCSRVCNCGRNTPQGVLVVRRSSGRWNVHVQRSWKTCKHGNRPCCAAKANVAA